MRHWIFAKQALECPWCQNLTPQTQYCRECQKWGDHTEATEQCPIMQESVITDHMEILSYISRSRTKKKSRRA